MLDGFVEDKALSEAFRKSFFQALSGWLYWAKIVRKFGLKNNNSRTLCILLPPNEPESTFYVIKLLDKAVQVRGFEKALVITPNSKHVKLVENITANLLEVVVCSDNAYNNLLQYSMYTGIDNRFINASLEKPSARSTNKIVGFKGICYESLVAYGVFGLVDYVVHESHEKECNEFVKYATE